MNGGWLFLAAYTSSGLAGLIYEVAWTRLLALYMGHTTAATSTVVAAFMGGLAAGSALGGRVAARLTRRQALYGYALVESIVVVTAIAVPLELRALAPLLRWAYSDGAPGALFPVTRLIACLAVLLLPTLALGATFPLAVRWFVTGSARTGRAGGALYAANTSGAALGALGSGFLLIPAIGVTGATLVGVATSILAIGVVLVVARRIRAEPEIDAGAAPAQSKPRAPAKSKPPPRSTRVVSDTIGRAPRPWLGATVLALTGFSTFLYEITWSRVFATVLGPSTYAFAATVTGLIAGLAAGAAFGSMLAGRTRRPELALAIALGCTAVAATWTSIYAGGGFARFVVQEFAGSSQTFGQLLLVHSLMVGALVAPAATGLGVSFPLALEVAGARDQAVSRRLGSVYAINTLASVAGSLTAGFLAIPLLGLQTTLAVAGAILLAGAVLVAAGSAMSPGARVAALAPTLLAAGLLVWRTPWDRELLASGGYKYGVHVPKDLDLITALKAGTLLYYGEGPTGIVSVKRLTGDLSLAIDGKVDASTTGDMLTQKALAHLPLLIHGSPKSVCIIGLGSGVTLASALVHPIASADLVEISPEVVDASRFFAAQNRNALGDPRTRLILGDGRSHLALSARRYDVIISEPSNPWMAGVASLFTREFFVAARNRLAPNGIICQWAHTYDISDENLRSVARTFASVFPNGTMWLVGDGDLLFVGSVEALEPRLVNIGTGWRLPGVAADLDTVSMREPFALWSLFVGGPGELEAFGDAAPAQSDDRMALEFSGPRAVNNSSAGSNAAVLRHLLDGKARPSTIADALSGAGATEWRDRAAMLMAANAYEAGYEDYVTALKLDPADEGALSGLVRAAVASHQEAAGVSFLKSLAVADATAAAPRVALSKLHAASGAFDAALVSAKDACLIQPGDAGAWEHLASLYADLADAAGLDGVVDRLQRQFPARPMTPYYAAASNFLHGRLPAALDLIRQAIQLDPRRAAARNMLGAIHASLGQTVEAREAFEGALGLDPRDSATYTNLGLLELSAGNRTRASALLVEALSLDPASTTARQALSEAR